MTEQTCRCIACGKTMGNIQEDGTLQPKGGLAFQTQGHYGSTVFDPMDGSLLEIAVCDDCLGSASRRGDVVLVDSDGARPHPAPRDAPMLITEPDMASAGAEVMGLAHRLKDVDGFAGEVERMRMIGAWISMGRISDGERAMVQVLGAIVQGMRDRGFAFHDDKPIADQVVAYVDAFGTQPNNEAPQPGYQALRDALGEAWRDAGRADVRVEGGRDGLWELVLGGHERDDGTLMVGADVHVRPDSTLAGTGEHLTWQTGTTSSGHRRETFRFGGTTLTISWSAKRRR